MNGKVEAHELANLNHAPQNPKIYVIRTENLEANVMKRIKERYGKEEVMVAKRLLEI